MNSAQSIYDKVDLSKIVTINIGKTPSRNNSSYWGKGNTWVTISDMNECMELFNTKEEITDYAVKEARINLVNQGTLLFSFKLSIGKVALAGKNLYTNEAIAALKIFNENKVDKKYLYYVLKEFDFTGTGDKAVKGLTLNKKKLEVLQIPLPILEIQKKIAEILDKADALRQQDEKIIEKYDQLTQSIFLDMFGDPMTNPKGWVVKKFGDYIEYLADIGSNGSNETVANNLLMSNTKDYAIMIRTVNLSSNNFSQNLKYISKKTYDFFSKSQIFGGELIMNKIGSAGEFWIMPNLGRPVSLGLNQFVIRLQNLNIKYLYYFLSTNYGKLNIKARLRGATTKSITKSAVRELPLLYSPLELQNQFAEIIEKIEKQKQLAKKSLEKSEELFQSLLQRAFKGELP